MKAQATVILTTSNSIQRRLIIPITFNPKNFGELDEHYQSIWNNRDSRVTTICKQ
jgi:hypothetical protein